MVILVVSDAGFEHKEKPIREAIAFLQSCFKEIDKCFISCISAGIHTIALDVPALTTMKEAHKWCQHFATNMNELIVSPVLGAKWEDLNMPQFGYCDDSSGSCVHKALEGPFILPSMEEIERRRYEKRFAPSVN